MTIKRLYATIEGRVQGVGFRFFVMQNAEALALTGWVCNTMDGKVEVLAEGEQDALSKLLSLLNSGPSGAFVSDVHSAWAPASGEFDHFGLRPSL